MNHTTAGWVVSILPCLVLLMSGTMKLIQHPTVVKNLTQFGFRETVLRPMGVLEYLLVALYLFPQTTFLGAILLTGWMGGAIATHFRVGDKFVIQTLLPIFVWVGWGLRHEAIAHAALGLSALS